MAKPNFIFFVLSNSRDLYASVRADAHLKTYPTSTRQTFITNLQRFDEIYGEIFKRCAETKPTHVIISAANIVPLKDVTSLLVSAEILVEAERGIIIVEWKKLRRFGMFKWATATFSDFAGWIIEKSKSQGNKAVVLDRKTFGEYFKALTLQDVSEPRQASELRQNYVALKPVIKSEQHEQYGKSKSTTA